MKDCRKIPFLSVVLVLFFVENLAAFEVFLNRSAITSPSGRLAGPSPTGARGECFGNPSAQIYATEGDTPPSMEDRAGKLLSNAPPGLLLLDPDDWSRDEIMKLRFQSAIPVAWLNVAQIEAERSFTSTLDRKVLLPAGNKYSEMKNPPVLFYLDYWQSHILQRTREIAQKGFQGILLTGLEIHGIISENPVSCFEMERLIKRISGEFRFHVPAGVILLRGGNAPENWIKSGPAHPEPKLKGAMEDALTVGATGWRAQGEFLKLIRESSFGESVDGIVIEGLWYGPGGKRVPKWKRELVLKILKVISGRGFEILTLDDANTAGKREGVFAESASHGFESAIASLPIVIQRSLRQ